MTTEVSEVKLDDEMTAVVAKLLVSYAFCPRQVRNVIPIYAQDLTDGRTLQNFRIEYAPWSQVETGPRGGQTRVNPVDVWNNQKDRVVVEGVQCAPGEEYPLFADDRGRKWINIFRAPAWSAAGGEISTWERYLAHLLPNQEERGFFTKWLAYKLKNPGVPGPAILMVARQHGAGRGTLFDILERFFSERFVRTVPFSTFTGKTHQSQYNEWQVGSVFVFVDESSEVRNGSLFHTRNNTYEHLKEVLDPRPRRIEVRVKGRDNYYAQSHHSTIIASNHADALPLPEGDRRIAVLTNGNSMASELSEAIHSWKASDANMAALQQWLWEVDLEGYDPFVPPPVFAGKARMISASKSKIDEAQEAARDSLQGRPFVIEQMIDRVKFFLGGYRRNDDIDDVVRRFVKNNASSVTNPDTKEPRLNMTRRDDESDERVRQRYHIYAWTDAEAKLWRSAANLREEILKNGMPGGAIPDAQRKALAAGLSVISERPRSGAPAPPVD